MNRSRAITACIASLALFRGEKASAQAAQSTSRVLYRSDAFAVTDTSVRQGRYEAIALSRDTIVSSYPRSAQEVHFKFSINSQENEFRPGTEHTIFVRPRNGRIATPVYAFGVIEPPHIPTPEESASSEEGTAQITFRLDMRGVLRSFGERGYYDPPNGPRIRAQEFEAVYVIGSPEPLTWDFRSLRPGSPLQLTDPDRDSIYTVTVPVAAMYTRPLASDGQAIWARRLDISGYPQLASSERLLDALYRMSLEELQQLVRDDGAFSAGAKWPGVWTRDVSLSAVLGLAMIAPDATRKSLMAKVDSAGRIIQDTGTGGSWPMSTDRMAWALAAWEVYAVTGDGDWLRNAYDIIRRSAEADLHAAFDRVTGLFHGESSFLDWREQSYPRWMDPKDIYQGEALGTNAIHYATYRILGNMSRALGEPSRRWDAIADTVQRGMNAHLWQATRGWYGQYRYGRNFSSLSPRSEGLGESLAMIYGVATPAQRTRLSASAPVVEFGEPSFWPYIPGEALYHNAAIWPFVNAYWTWAAAEAGNPAGVERGLATIYRPAALFLTNKENMVAATGHFEGTVLNSDRQLWSVAGNLAMTYRVLFGMRLEPDRLVFRPMVPHAYGGERTLRNLHYRGSTLTITVRGFGDGVARALLDRRPVSRSEISAALEGAHTLEIEMNGHWPDARAALVENRYTPAAPVVELWGDTLVWSPVSGATSYGIYRDGQRVGIARDTHAAVRQGDGLSEYQVAAINAGGLESFLSEPIRVVSESAVRIIQPVSQLLEHVHQGFTGAGYVSLTRERNTSVQIPIAVSTTGMYSIDVRYANGNGPINSGDKAAMRTLLVDGRPVGIVVMPHRGTDLWTDWGYSNPLQVALPAGAHLLTLAYTALDQNMNRHENTALLDHVRVTRLPSR
jgi:Bacterial alpha-L-rhamnosidase 6 hairpin glycosidase domain